MIKMLKLMQDNGNCNSNYGLEPGCYTAKVDENTLKFECRNFFNWRTSTKKYNSFYARVNSLGSHKRNEFIAYLVTQGY